MLTDTVCAALSAAGLGIALLTAYRKRFRAATRIAAYALLPVGLAMAGVIDWVADLVFKPAVWVGFGVLGLSWLLFVVSRWADRRAADGGSRKERRAAQAAARGDALAPEASAPSLGPGRTDATPQPEAKAKPKAKTKPGGSGSGAEDFSDIEAILKKHGI